MSKLSSLIDLILSSKVKKTYLFLGLLGTILFTMSGLAIPLLTRELIDDFSLNSISMLFIIVIGFVFVFQAILDGISSYLLANVGYSIVAGIRERMWAKLIQLPVRFFDKESSGNLVSRLTNDTGIVNSLISSSFPQFIRGVITIVGTVLILFIMDWKMTLVLLIAIPFTVLVLGPLGKKMSVLSKEIQDTIAEFSGKTQQTLSEIRLMKFSVAESFEKKREFL